MWPYPGGFWLCGGRGGGRGGSVWGCVSFSRAFATAFALVCGGCGGGFVAGAGNSRCALGFGAEDCDEAFEILMRCGRKAFADGLSAALAENAICLRGGVGKLPTRAERVGGRVKCLYPKFVADFETECGCHATDVKEFVDECLCVPAAIGGLERECAYGS